MTPLSLESSKRFVKWGVLASATSESMCFYAIVPYFAAAVHSDFGISVTQTGYIYAMFAVGFLCASILTAPLRLHGYTIGRLRQLYALTSGIVAIGTLGVGVVPPVFKSADIGPDYIAACLCVLRLLCGLTVGTGATICLVVLTRAFPESSSEVVSWVELTGGLGALVGPAVGGVIYDIGGFAAPPAVLAAVVIATSAVVAFCPLDERLGAEAAKDTGTQSPREQLAKDVSDDSRPPPPSSSNDALAALGQTSTTPLLAPENALNRPPSPSGRDGDGTVAQPAARGDSRRDGVGSRSDDDEIHSEPGSDDGVHNDLADSEVDQDPAGGGGFSPRQVVLVMSRPFPIALGPMLIAMTGLGCFAFFESLASLFLHGELQLSASAQGGLFAFIALIYAVCAVVFGKVMGRQHPLRRVVALPLALVVYAVGMVLVGSDFSALGLAPAGDVPPLPVRRGITVVGLAVTAVAMGVTTVVGQTCVVDVAVALDPKMANAGGSIANAALSVAAFTGIIAGAHLTEAFGFHDVLLIWAATCVSVGFIFVTGTLLSSICGGGG